MRRRAIVGSQAMFGGFGIGQVLRLISNLVLTRLLVPEAFGLMAVAISINIWANMLTDIGIGPSIIRSKNSDDPNFLRTAWTMQILRNCLVWTIIMLAALVVWLIQQNGLVADTSIYADGRLPILMSVLGLQLLISALGSTNRAFAERRLAMNRVVAVEIGSQLVAMTTTISLAYLGYGVWSLAIGTLVGAAASASVSHFVFPGPRMALNFTREYVGEIFHFGKWLIIASFFGFIMNRGDQVIFGWTMEAEAFSLYAVATLWIIAASGLFLRILNRIFYPVIAEVIRERPHDLSRIYRKMRLLLDAMVTAMAIGAVLFAEPVFGLIYTDQFESVGYFVKLLAPVFLFLPYRIINTLVLATGDSKGFTGVTVLGGTVMIIALPLASHFFGAKAMILTYACLTVVTLPISWRLAAKHMTLDLATEGRLLVIAAIIVFVLAVGESHPSFL